jgi:hypothetical protein
MGSMMVKNIDLYFFLTYDILSEMMMNTFLHPVSLVASEGIKTLKEKC